MLKTELFSILKLSRSRKIIGNTSVYIKENETIQNDGIRSRFSFVQNLNSSKKYNSPSNPQKDNSTKTNLLKIVFDEDFEMLLKKIFKIPINFI